MQKDKSRDKFYFIQLNLQKEKHKELIGWIKELAAKREQSFSSFVISILKEYMEDEKIVSLSTEIKEPQDP